MMEDSNRVEATEPGAVDAPAEVSAIPPEELERLTDDIIAALKSVYDLEIPVDIPEDRRDGGAGAFALHLLAGEE